VAVDGDQVRLGIVAPRDVTVDRSEVHARRTQDSDVSPPVPPAEGVIDPEAAGGASPGRPVGDLRTRLAKAERILRSRQETLSRTQGLVQAAKRIITGLKEDATSDQPEKAG
jgi:hypothetical protein